MSDLTPKITERRKFDKWLEDVQFVVDPNPNDKPGIQVVTVEAVRKYFAAIVEVESLRELQSKWECIAEHGEGTPVTDSFNFRCAMERCAAELGLALAAAAPQSGEGKKG